MNVNETAGILQKEKNTDSVYDGNKVFQLISVVEYIDSENAVVSKSYLGDDNNSYRQVKVVNDWLGRGVTEEYIWPGNNGTGEVRVVRNSYNHTGNLVLKEMPNGEKYGYIYNSEGQLEKSQYPDGKYSIVNYDNNGNVLKTKDRRGITVTNSYNKSDMPIKSESGDLEISTLYSHLGPAAVTEKEDSAETLKKEYEFHFSGGVTKNTQTIDGSIIQIIEGSFDDGGNQITTKATGSGTGVNEWGKELNIDSQYHSSDPDGNHFNKTAILDGASVKILRESDYLGLQNKISYGTTAGSEVSYTYDNFLKLKSLISSEAALGMDITLTRDFTGNILTKENNTYTYDGMNRLLSGEGEDYRYDEISNLLVRGTKTYEYQFIGTDKNQMRLKSFSDRGASYLYEYDSNGNTTIVSGRFTTISYDNLNRLREITHADTRIDRYSYNFSGLRFKKEEDVNGSNIVLYSLYRGNNPVIQEKYEGSTLVETRFNIISGGQVIAHVRKVYGVSENFEYFYLDNLGSRRVVLDESGAVTDKFTYSAYGEVTHVPSSNDYLASFTGKEYDSTGLLYFNARYYDPVVGRFLTEDPSRDGTNWYGYCNNNPINFVDPTGFEGNEPGSEERQRAYDKRQEEKKSHDAGSDRSIWDKVKEIVDKAIEFSNKKALEKLEKGQIPNTSYYRPTTSYMHPRYFTQGMWVSGFKPTFAGKACAATSLLNELSERYTMMTGKQLDFTKATQMMRRAVDENKIRSTDAYVMNWEEAANTMWEKTGLSGSFKYNINGEHRIYAIEYNDGDSDPDHFVNSYGMGTDIYFDPNTGLTGISSDLNLQKDKEYRGLDYIP